MPSLVPHSKQLSSLVVGGMCAVAAFVVLAGTSGPLRSTPTGDDSAVGGTPTATCPAGTTETEDACVRVVRKVLPPLRPAAAPAPAAVAPAAPAPERVAPQPVRVRTAAPVAAPARTAEREDSEDREHEDSPEPREQEHEEDEHDD